MHKAKKAFVWLMLFCALAPSFYAFAAVPVTDLDLGDYYAEMEVGTSQVLMVTVIPLNADNQTLSYNSSNPGVASVNGIGRISALVAGQTMITVTCGSISRNFNLTVKERETTTVPTTVRATDLDLGDPQKKMTVGETQMLMVTVIPTNTTNQNLTYNSSNAVVAEVNAIGRITAKRAGSATITVSNINVSRNFQLEVVNQEVTTTVRATDIDLGDPQKKMTVGDTQMLMATVIPANATNQELKYKSSSTIVAEVNALGRVTAKRAGTTTITVSCGSASKSFTLEVVNEILATGIDLGEPPKEMAIGSTQMLYATVIPTDAKNQTLTYKSSNSQVAAVNELGRISALAAGEATITVSCGRVSKTFQLKVVPVAIEVEDFEDELAVDETLRLAARVTPDNAPVTTIQYKSSDPKIATVNPSGEVKGIAPGHVTITLTAGEVTKEITLIVNIAGKRINLNSKYIILKPGESFTLQANLVPADARQTIKFKSFDSNVAAVSASGVITAQGFGTTTVLASTDDTGAAATVIVNQSGTVEEATEPATLPANASPAFPNTINAQDYPVLTQEMLKYYYESGVICTVTGDGYQLSLRGKDIVNYNNEFKTIIAFSKEENGISFVLNDGKPLCGSITVETGKAVEGAKYLYLLNESTGKYRQLQTNGLSVLKLDVAGKYLIAEKKITGFKLNAIFFIIAGVVVLGGLAAYIAVKKRHWFW